MNKFKRLSATALAGVLALGMMAGSASAATITVTGGNAGEYSAYRLLDLTTSLKGDCGHMDGAHEAGCWNYNYTVSEKYRAVLQAAAGAGADTDGDGGVSDAELLNYVSAMASDSDAIRGFADAVYGGIKTAGLGADASAVGTGTATDIDIGENQGYYLIVESAKANDPDMVSFVMLDTAGKENVTVISKQDVPTLAKRVLDKNGNPVEGRAVRPGDEITYQLTVTIPGGNLLRLNKLVLTLHDTMDAGIVYKTGSFVSEHSGALISGATLPEWAMSSDRPYDWK